MVVTMVDTLDEDARKDLERIEEEVAAEAAAAVEDYDAMDEGRSVWLLPFVFWVMTTCLAHGGIFVLVYETAQKRRMRAWRNGRRAGFRCQWASAREGSTPFARTKAQERPTQVVGLFRGLRQFYPPITYNVLLHLSK